MRTFTVERATRLLGVALLVSAGFSAGMRHAHPGGGGWDHDHGPGTIGAIVAGPANGSGWFSTPLHMHIFLWGFQFTLPAEEPSHGDEHFGERPIMMQLASHDLADSSARLSPAPCHDLPAATAQLDASVVPVAERMMHRPRLEIAGPLCESARHERSGVLRT